MGSLSPPLSAKFRRRGARWQHTDTSHARDLPLLPISASAGTYHIAATSSPPPLLLPSSTARILTSPDRPFQNGQRRRRADLGVARGVHVLPAHQAFCVR
ncbi:hypothetical protein AcW1_004066 [Taiwanofungus camphoratus]|nr:hypothetical protein AcW1_004066 [Antrodia cinnamomea]